MKQKKKKNVGPVTQCIHKINFKIFLPQPVR